MNLRARVVVCVFSFSAILIGASPAAAQGIGLVSDSLIAQKTNVWCWAASGEMTMNYFGDNVQQCTQATYQFGQAAGVNCCSNPIPGACVSGGQVEIGHYGFTYQQLGGSSALSYAQIEDQISNRREPWIFNPYCADQSKCGKWGHVLTGVGYFAPFQNIFPELSDFFFLFVNDPWPPNTGSFYLEFYPAYKDGCWWGNGSCDGYAEGWDIYDIVAPRKAPPRYIPLEPMFKIPPEEARIILKGDPDPERVAQLSWKAVTAALTGDVAINLGFTSAAEARGMKLTKPIEQFHVSHERLRSFSPQANAESMLVHSPSLLVPVEGGGHVRASIRLRQEGKQWRLIAVGSPQFSAAWERARGRGAEFLVFVEGLEIPLAGKRINGKVTMHSLYDIPMYHLKEGEELPAERMLGNLAPHALNYKGNGATIPKLVQPLR